jgi:hypothetical protein
MRISEESLINRGYEKIMDPENPDVSTFIKRRTNKGINAAIQCTINKNENELSYYFSVSIDPISRKSSKMTLTGMSGRYSNKGSVEKFEELAIKMIKVLCIALYGGF